MELIFVTQQVWPDIRPLQQKLAAVASKKGLSFRTITDKDKYATQWEAIRDAKLCVVWHGLTPISCWAREIRRSRGMHCVVAECGWFPQSDNWAFDRKGFCGLSSLCGPLEDVDPEYLEDVRHSYWSRLEAEPSTPMVEGAVLVPLQLPRDSAVYAHAPYPTMKGFVDHVLEKFHDKVVVFKTHPKAPNWPLRSDIGAEFMVVRGGWFPGLAAKADLVYGQTSNALYEAALMGVPVEAIGDCPLKHHSHDVNRLLAVMAKVQVSRKASIERFCEAIDE